MKILSFRKDKDGDYRVIRKKNKEVVGYIVDGLFNVWRFNLLALPELEEVCDFMRKKQL